jgi:hypothetical protein
MYESDYFFGETNPFYAAFKRFDSVIYDPSHYEFSYFVTKIMEAVVGQMRLEGM